MSQSLTRHLPLVLATRKSQLALWQAEWVQDYILQHPALAEWQPELLPMSSTGDVRLEARLAHIGGKGLFTKELDAAMLDGSAHLAVHSLKDVPQQPIEDFYYRYTERHDVEDVAIFPDDTKYRRLQDLPAGSVVGTSSIRRQALLAAHYPDLKVKVLRGNVNTRLAKLNNPEEGYAAIILAKAGVNRLGFLKNLKHQVLSRDKWVPAPGQGIVAIQCNRQNDFSAYSHYLDNPISRICALFERGVSLALGGACSLPLGVNTNFINRSNIPLNSAELSQEWNAYNPDLAQPAEPTKPTKKGKPVEPVKSPFEANHITGVKVTCFMGDMEGYYLNISHYFTLEELHIGVDCQVSDLAEQAIAEKSMVIADKLRQHGFEEFLSRANEHLARERAQIADAS